MQDSLFVHDFSPFAGNTNGNPHAALFPIADAHGSAWAVSMIFLLMAKFPDPCRLPWALV